ncbi:glycoside hydrolase family 16 protein [Niabella drilacis]|uniref:Glycosyl hydrolases family 16 n=1 Tax=Niabella drilacis (strain DSM 25811 / CCM 8410 / CCUG 62505 / LMG 26954 / E90) TaxID=1285928 RepID=A0A1G6J8W4_NIADE|nr:glycoside hydrolase family 16 protein [Niabella drilacis]SDC15248.1 Glycosyl hydrolases family 16 [Niabella drilacis]
MKQIRNYRQVLWGCSFFLMGACSSPKHLEKEGYRLVWADEFNKPGRVDTSVWRFEKGFERNHELQWYQEENAWCENGLLVIEARKEVKPNPRYRAGSNEWRDQRQHIEYTSSSINTRGTKSWQYGRFVMRAKIRTENGLWPAFWTLGARKPWPSNGEIDIMEYYRGDLLANIAGGTAERNKAKWFTVKKPVASFGDKNWSEKFHIWRMDWDEKEIRLYVDDLLMNRVSLDQLVNPDGFNPFKQPHYILLDLAIGGDNGGDPSLTVFPNRYLVDYVRVYQK